MKISTVSNESIEVSDSFKELTFNIRSEDMGFVLDILRSKMYKNPVEAICREITSNARDANREAGKRHVPIEISFESDFMSDNMCMVISDNGVGISEERMGDVFINYGASTKRNTNSQTGGFGLGAKTPFSYTDNFSIVTRVDGVKYNYVAVIEENSNGKILQISKEDTDEPNGTRIYIPIKSYDRSDFELSILKSTLLWEVRPIYKNFEYYGERYYSEMEVEHHNEFAIVKNCSRFFYGSMFLLIDEIPYELDLGASELPIRGINTNNVYFLKFKTGMLTISATRENVHYDKETIKKIQNRFKVFIDYILKTLQDELDVCTNYIQAVCTIKKYHQDNKYNDFIKFVKKGDSLNLTWQGNPLNWHCYNINFDGFRVIKLDKNNNRWFADTFDLNMLSKKWYMLDRVYIDEGRATSIPDDYVYILEPSDKRTIRFSKLPYSQKKYVVRTIRKMQEDVKWLNNNGITFENFSSIEPNKTYKREKKEYVNIKYIDGSLFPTDTFSSDLSDVGEGYYIVRDYRNESWDDKKRFETIRNIVNFFKIRCYVFGKTLEPKIKNTQLKNIESSLPEIFSKSDGLKKLINRKYISANMTSFSNYRSIDDELMFLNKLDLDQDTKDSVKKICDIINDNRYDLGYVSSDVIEEFTKYYSVDSETKILDDDIKKIKEVFDKYELIKYILDSYNSHSDKTAIQELNLYIKYKNQISNGGSI